MKELKLFILGLIFLTACSEDKAPTDVLDQKQMIKIMADLHTMDGYMSSMLSSDSIRRQSKDLYATIYKSHNTTEKLYEKSLKYYSMKPVLLDSMYSRVEFILTEKERKIQNNLTKKHEEKLQKQK